MFVQVASSEWSLGIQIQHYENQLNAEIREDRYCCCEIKDACNATLNDFINATHNCKKNCSVYYKVQFPNCSTNGICSTTQPLNFKYYPRSIVTKMVFPIALDQFEVDNEVRINFISNLISKKISAHPSVLDCNCC